MRINLYIRNILQGVKEKGDDPCLRCCYNEYSRCVLKRVLIQQQHLIEHRTEVMNTPSQIENHWGVKDFTWEIRFPKCSDFFGLKSNHMYVINEEKCLSVSSSSSH